MDHIGKAVLPMILTATMSLKHGAYELIVIHEKELKDNIYFVKLPFLEMHG